MVNGTEMIKKMKTVLDNVEIAGRTCEFYSSEHECDCDEKGCGIWMSAEGGNISREHGLPVFDYWANEYVANHYDCGVLKSFEKYLSNNGWYAEFYDAGTVMVYPV